MGATSEVHYALYPASLNGVVGSSDFLRLAFAGVLLVGIAADMRASSRALASAEIELRRLRDAELAKAALEERARLAREIHDGLSQHLWLAKLRLEQLAGKEDQRIGSGRFEELAELIDTGLAEAQQTVVALYGNPGELPLRQTLTDFIQSFSRQRGLPADVELDDAIAHLSPRIGAELLRVVQEALTNVARHADATRVTVRARRTGSILELEVRDNGIGFEAERIESGFGLRSMRERVEGIGGVFMLRSSPSAGTLIRAEVPIGA